MPKHEELMQGLGGLDPLDAPVPGESLTTNPEARMPYEKPSEFSNQEEASEAIFMLATAEGNVDNMLDLMRQEIPVENIAQIILFQGFREGKWNPDLMLLLVEPTIYILLAIAEFHGVDAVLYPEDDMIDPEDEALESFKDLGKVLPKSEESIETGEAPTGDSITADGRTIQRPSAVPEDIMSRIKEKLGSEGEV